MDIDMIRTQILEIFENLCTQKITDTSLQLIGDLAMDSLCMIMLLVTIEEVFEIDLDESDMNPFALLTIQDAINLVAKYKIESVGE